MNPRRVDQAGESSHLLETLRLRWKTPSAYLDNNSYKLNLGKELNRAFDTMCISRLAASSYILPGQQDIDHSVHEELKMR